MEDLPNLNDFFNRIDDEIIVYQYIISNLNDADKEIKILDQEKIKLTLLIIDEDQKINLSFVLFKTINDFEGEEGNQEELMNNNNEKNENEGEIEEGLDIMENLIEDHDGEGDYPMEHQLTEGEIDIKKLKEKEEIKINDNKINKEEKKIMFYLLIYRYNCI